MAWNLHRFQHTMSLEAATDPRIRPPIGRRSSPVQRAAAPQERAPPHAPAPFSNQGHRGGTRVFDHGPGADHPTATAELGLDELIDVLNPLQHLPVISSLYRHLTGDEIETPARVMGGTLYGGPVGFLTSLATALVTEIGGGDPGDTVLAQLFGAPESRAENLAARPKDPVGPGVEAALQDEATQVANSAQDPAPPVTAGSDVSPRDFFTERMLSGLDKYHAMARSGGPAMPGSLLDRRM